MLRITKIERKIQYTFGILKKVLDNSGQPVYNNPEVNNYGR